MNEQEKLKRLAELLRGNILMPRPTPQFPESPYTIGTRG